MSPQAVSRVWARGCSFSTLKQVAQTQLKSRLLCTARILLPLLCIPESVTENMRNGDLYARIYISTPVADPELSRLSTVDLILQEPMLETHNHKFPGSATPATVGSVDQAPGYWSEDWGFKPEHHQAATAELLSMVLNPHIYDVQRKEFHCTGMYVANNGFTHPLLLLL